MANEITVWFNGEELIISKAVADSFKLTEGYEIETEEELCEILYANSSLILSICEHINRDKEN